MAHAIGTNTPILINDLFTPIRRLLFPPVIAPEKIIDPTFERKSLIFHKAYIWAVFLALVVVSIISQALFPTTFSMYIHTISDQGSILLNPTGHLVWQIGVVINGLAHIPHLHYIASRLSSSSKIGARLFQVIGLIAAIGFSLVGLISLDYGAPHYIVAVIAFVGYYIDGILCFILLAKKGSPYRKMLAHNFQLQIFYVYFIASGALCLGSFFLYDAGLLRGAYPPLEWNYLAAICLWLLTWPSNTELKWPDGN